MFLTNQIVELLEQLYLKKNGVNQPDSLLVDIDSRKANVFKGWP